LAKRKTNKKQTNVYLCAEMTKFKLEGEFIPLISLLKAISAVQSGGEAQAWVEEGLIRVNNQVEYRKRLKLRIGDKIQFFNQTVVIC